MRRFIRSTALALALGFYLPAPGPVTGIVFNPAAYADEAGKIPDWIAKSCCGPQDVRRLRADQVHHNDDDGYWTVDGYNGRINDKEVKPSQDGNYWAFFADYPAGDDYSPQGGRHHREASQSGMYCFFVPMAF